MPINSENLRAIVPTAELTITDGTITPTQMVHYVGAQTSTSDNLDTINPAGGVQYTSGGDTYYGFLILRAATDDTITVRHNQGNIILNDGGNIDLTGDAQLLLWYNNDTTNWTDLSFGASSSGDVTGAASSTDNAIARFDGTGGKTIQNSGVTIDDSDNVATPGDVTAVGDYTAFSGTSKEIELAEETLQILSTGVYDFDGLAINGGDDTMVDVGAGAGHIVNNHDDIDNPTYTSVSWSADTISITNIATQDLTWIYVDSAGAIQQTNTAPTQEQRRERLYLGRAAHANNTAVTGIISNPNVVPAVQQRFEAFMDAIGLINKGVSLSANGANLKLNRSAGAIVVRGANFVTDPTNPDEVSIASASAFTFQYRTQTAGSTGTDTTDIVPASYDNAGTITTVPNPTSKATNQRIYVFPGVPNFRIQYGQTVYDSLDEAIQGAATEDFVTNPNFVGNAILIGILSVTKGATDLSDSADARFLPVSPFGFIGGGAVSSSTGGGGTPDFGAAATIEISSDDLAAGSSRYVIVDGQGSADDELHEITGVTEGQLIALVAAPGITIDVINNEGAASVPILLGRDTKLSEIHPLVLFHNGSALVDVSGGAENYVFTRVDDGADYTTSSTSFVDVDATDVAVTLVTTGGDIQVDFTAPCTVSNGTASLYLDVDIDGSRVAGDDGAFIQAPPNSALTFTARLSVIATGLSAGSHTIKIQWKVSAATGTMYAGAGTSGADGHPYLIARELK